MNRLQRSERDKLQELRGLASATQVSSYQRLNLAAINKVFDHYKEPDADIMGVDGISRFCEDLDVSPEDIVLLVISYYMQAALMCEYQREEFCRGMAVMGVESVAGLRAKLPALRAALADPKLFAEVYKFAYAFSREKGQRCVPQEAALEMWRLVLGPAAPPQCQWAKLEDWIAFLERSHNKPISKDTWAQLLDFIRVIRPDFSNYDENSAWPYLLDEFVEAMRRRRDGSGGGGGAHTDMQS